MYCNQFAGLNLRFIIYFKINSIIFLLSQFSIIEIIILHKLIKNFFSGKQKTL